MDNQGNGWKVDTAGGDVRRYADAGSLVAQRLKRIVALRLAMLSRQRHCLEAALGQAGMAVAMLLVGRHRRPPHTEEGDQAGDEVEGRISE